MHTGGGTDVTALLQAVLDCARDEGGIRLVMDGAALVSHLCVYDNTVIECVTRDCGFYQADGSDNSIITNAVGSHTDIVAHHITLTGGTYNQNCAHQTHDRAWRAGDLEFTEEAERCVFGMEFYGVEDLTIRDLKVRDFRTFGVTVGCFRNVTIENVWLDLPGHMDGQNQDGFHFWGPGQFLTVRNVGDRVGDDFMNICPDEMDRCSSISDVLVDGVFLDGADQGIRLLSRGTGRLDRCTIRNVSGTYKSFGFYVNCWFPDTTYSGFGDLFFENIDLKQLKPNYDYRAPFLFRVGGNIRSLLCRNLRHIDPSDARALFEVGLPNYNTKPSTAESYIYPGKPPVIDYFEVDGLTILEKSRASCEPNYIVVFGSVGTMVVRHETAINQANPASASASVLVDVKRCAKVDTLILDTVHAAGAWEVLRGEDHTGRLLWGKVIQ